MKVLLVVDAVNDFGSNGAVPVQDGEGIVRPINQLMENGGYDLVIAVREGHKPGHVSFYTSHPGRKEHDVIRVRGIEQHLWAEHGIPGTWGGEFFPGLRTDLFDHVLEKGTDLDVDSYSAFCDNEKGKETGLRALLEEQAAERGEALADVEVDVVGLALEYCIGFTIKDSVGFGIPTRLVLDGTRAVNLNPGDDLKALKELTELGVDVVESREITQGASQKREVSREWPQERSAGLIP